MSIVGNTYLERGQPVTVLIGWKGGGGPHNVMIRRADGTQVIRPFRGLRKPAADAVDPPVPSAPADTTSQGDQQ